MTAILGISAFYHDSAAALIVDGKIIAAAQEERFTRIKNDPAFPTNAVEFVLKTSGLRITDIDQVVFYETPSLKFKRLILSYLALAPRGFHLFASSLRVWLGGKLQQRRLITKHLSALHQTNRPLPPIHFAKHHTSHAASAYYPAPFSDALILTIDGVGEMATTTVSRAQGTEIAQIAEVQFPHSIGLLYSTFTQYIGFKVNSGEYKLMGLAPYGTPKYKDKILTELIDVKDDGSFRLNMKYFAFQYGRRMLNDRFEMLFGEPIRRQESEPITQFHKDIAASIQAVTEEIILKIATHWQQKTGARNLCMAGGVALNCVANGLLRDTKIFDNIWIQPAAGDAGGALGAALWFWHNQLKQPKSIAQTDTLQGAYLGPSYTDAEIADVLSKNGAVFQTVTSDELIQTCVEALDKGQALGWFQGRMEFGPRALGARSILADPRRADMQKTLNLKIKKRESFRPFAPAVLQSKAADWFECADPTPYMQFVTKVTEPTDRIPAVTHVNGTARLQTVDNATNPLFHKLLSAFDAATSCPVLVNTSFNVRGEPIVCDPRDAWRCFMATDLDLLAIGGHILIKTQQVVPPPSKNTVDFLPD